MTGFSDYSASKIPRSVKDDGIFGLLDFENPAVSEHADGIFRLLDFKNPVGLLILG